MAVALAAGQILRLRWNQLAAITSRLVAVETGPSDRTTFCANRLLHVSSWTKSVASNLLYVLRSRSVHAVW